MPRKSSYGKKLVLLALGLVLGLLTAEVGLRLIGVSHPLLYAPDPVCGTRLQAGFRGWWTKEGRAFIRINEYGWRHGNRPPEKPPNTIRVAVLGDSFIEALQVPEAETFGSQLERRLTDCPDWNGRQVEVLEFGVSGYGTAQELLMLRRYVWDYQPDIVVLAFFAGNDLRNNSAELEPYRVRPFFRIAGDGLALDDSFLQSDDYRKATSTLVRWKVAAINRSRILQLLNVIKNRPAPQAREAKGAANSQAGIDLAPLAPPESAEWTAAWELAERLILEINREVESHGARLYLLPVTSDVQIHPDPAVVQACCQQLGVADLLYPERRLIGFSREHGIAAIALAEAMQQHVQQHGRPLHGFPNTRNGEGHWNAEGHRVAAETAAATICP